MRQRFLKKIFSSGLQAVAVQILGAAFFFVISKYLSKDDFGIISWGNAFALMLTTILGFGLEQVVTRRIAASSTSEWAAGAFLLHALAGSAISFLTLWSISFIVPSTDQKYHLLPWLFTAQSLLYIGTPLKQFLNARHQFTPYGVIAIISNSIKIVLALIFISKGTLFITTAIQILIVCGIFEFAALAIYVFTKTNFNFNVRFNAYKKLLKESMPQYIAAIFDASLSRLSWILVGLITTDAITGSYSFAFRAFELSRLPIFIVAPIILNVFSKMLSGNATMQQDTQARVGSIFIAGSFLTLFVPLILNILWSPLMDKLFDGKYGSSNAMEFLLLSVCLPLQFFINVAWTLCFGARKYKQISTITIISASSNLVLNLVLIKLMGGAGAAIAFLLTNAIQLLLYYRHVRSIVQHFPLQKFSLIILTAAGSYYLAVILTENMWLQMLIAVAAYTLVALLLKLVNKNNFTAIQSLLKK